MENLSHIVAGCLEQRERDQRALYERYFGYCLKTAFRYIYHYDTAVDVVNDSFLKIFRNLSRFVCQDTTQMEMMLMGWMRMIVINTAIDQLRKNSFLPEIGDIADYVWELSDNAHSPENNILYKEVIATIRKLPPAYRAVFNLYVIDGYTHQQIAVQLGISVGTSKSNLSKARASLQKLIKKNDEEVIVCSM